MPHDKSVDNLGVVFIRVLCDVIGALVGMLIASALIPKLPLLQRIRSLGKNWPLILVLFFAGLAGASPVIICRKVKRQLRNLSVTFASLCCKKQLRKWLCGFAVQWNDFERSYKKARHTGGRLEKRLHKQALGNFFSEYSKQEVGCIKHLYVHSNFEIMSQVNERHLRELVAAKHTGSVCVFTSLAIPLEKWFNFEAGDPAHPEYFNRVNFKWEQYKAAVADVKDTVTLLRCLVVAAEDREDGGKLGAPVWPGSEICQTRNELLKALNKVILVKNDWPTARPLEIAEIERICQDIAQASSSYADEIKRQYYLEGAHPSEPESKPQAYLILGKTEGESLPAIPEYSWYPLSYIFRNDYHSDPTEYPKVFKVRNANTYTHTFENRGLHCEFILFGQNTSASTRWIFGHCARVSPDLDNLKLEFMDPHVAQNLFEKYDSLARNMMKCPSILEEFGSKLEEKKEENN